MISAIIKVDKLDEKCVMWNWLPAALKNNRRFFLSFKLAEFFTSVGKRS